MSSIILNTKQQMAKDGFLYWYYHPESRVRPWYEVSGPAGSGKTTVVRSITIELGLSDGDEILYVAFIGKAALALRLSGVPGRTIHSVVYHPIKVPAVDKVTKEPILINGNPKMVFRFIKNETLGDRVKLIVLDEGGMVEQTMGRDLLSFGIPMLVLGDLNQLPPVFGVSMFLQKPDIILDTVMRQAKGSPILYLSDLARLGYQIQYGEYGENSEVQVVRKRDFLSSHEFAQAMLRDQDMVICGTNNMRDNLNDYIRSHMYGKEGPMVEVGDKLICRHNYWTTLLPKNPDIALTNGMVGYVEYVNKRPSRITGKVEIDFQPEFTNDIFRGLPIDRKYMFDPYEKRRNVMTFGDDKFIFELGYCITCHLAQGSQGDSVLVFVESYEDSDYFRKWLYTAITRAKKRLILVM
ncbi:MAG: ATP-dependent RecD-like DNA helicase [Lachnospiraceae bacterium]|nr:ATP-dependent RecD-like DNA helicase [Lachnospiraceae bacterium]